MNALPPLVSIGHRHGTPATYCHYCMMDFQQEVHRDQGMIDGEYVRYQYIIPIGRNHAGWVSFLYRGVLVERPVLLCDACQAKRLTDSLVMRHEKQSFLTWLDHVWRCGL